MSFIQPVLYIDMLQIDGKNPNYIERILIWIQKQDQFTIFLLITIILALIIEPSPTSNTPLKPLQRKNFSASTKEFVLKNQFHSCNFCDRPLDEVNFDHIDGDRSNNNMWNCQALCPNCHAEKTRKRKFFKI